MNYHGLKFSLTTNSSSSEGKTLDQRKLCYLSLLFDFIFSSFQLAEFTLLDHFVITMTHIPTRQTNSVDLC